MRTRGGTGAEYAHRFGVVAQEGDVHQGFGRQEVSKSLRVIHLMNLRIGTFPKGVGFRAGVFPDSQTSAAVVFGKAVDGDGVPVIGFQHPDLLLIQFQVCPAIGIDEAVNGLTGVSGHDERSPGEFFQAHEFHGEHVLTFVNKEIFVGNQGSGVVLQPVSPVWSRSVPVL